MYRAWTDAYCNIEVTGPVSKEEIFEALYCLSPCFCLSIKDHNDMYRIVIFLIMNTF